MFAEISRAGRGIPTAVLMCALLVLAACNGGSEGADGTDGTGGEDAGNTDSGGNRGNPLAGFTDSDCRQYARAFEGVPTVTDPNSLEGLGELAAVFEAAADEVPNEISDDFKVIAEAFGDYADALGDANFDFSDPSSFQNMSAADLEALGRASESFAAQEYADAATNISEFLEENCRP